ncbi:MAG: hypothetical protein V3U11_07555, partial [Planctomycetota bacterium]
MNCTTTRANRNRPSVPANSNPTSDSPITHHRAAPTTKHRTADAANRNDPSVHVDKGRGGVSPDGVSPDMKEEGLELVAGLPSGELERRLLQVHRDTEVGHRQLAFYLNDMQARGIYQLLGYRSAVHCAVERLDMHRRKAQMLVAVGAALLRLRVLDHAFAEGQISWSKTRLLCRVATEDTEVEWLAKARELACRELEWLARSCLPGDRPPSGGGGGGLPKARFHVHAELGALDYE